MRSAIFSLGIAALALGSCTHGCRDTTLYQMSGRQKAIVAVLPVMDHTNSSGLAWELSREFTDEIRKRVFDSKTLYLLRDGSTLDIAKQLSVPNPAVIAPAALDSLGAAEFVIVSEIISQDEQTYGVGSGDESLPYRSEVGAIFSLALRVRILDLREPTPKLVLQEILYHDDVVALPYIKCNYDKMRWGTDAFEHTPMGLAHNRLIRELAARAEAYIEAAR